MSKIKRALLTQNETSISEITKRIYTLRGTQVMIDSDLAKIYEIENYNLKKAVRRNTERFPGDFFWEATKDELESLIFQSGIPKSSPSGSAELPLLAGISDTHIPDQPEDPSLIF